TERSAVWATREAASVRVARTAQKFIDVSDCNRVGYCSSSVSLGQTLLLFDADPPAPRAPVCRQAVGADPVSHSAFPRGDGQEKLSKRPNQEPRAGCERMLR